MKRFQKQVNEMTQPTMIRLASLFTIGFVSVWFLA